MIHGKTGRRQGLGGPIPPSSFLPAFLLILSLSPFALADTPPSAWDFAREAGVRDDWTLHVRARRLMHAPRPDGMPDALWERQRQLQLEAARSLLEDAHAERSADPRVRFDLGIVSEELRLDRRAAEILAPAVDAAPDHPYATEGLGALSYAYARLDRPRDELAAWRRYVARLESDEARPQPMMNMGEAEMRLGLVDDALATFREVLRICERLPNTITLVETYALTLWDLAIALDRSGDPRAAIDTAGKAMSFAVGQGVVRPRTGWDLIHDERVVFFVPEWERNWYFALGAAAQARDAKGARESARAWREAEQNWARYVARSTEARSKDPWLPIARVRLEHARVERESAERRAGKLPPPREEESGRPWDF